MADNRPVRLQFRRVKNFDLQAHSLATNGLPAVLCTRPGKWGNPFVVGVDGTATECVDLFESNIHFKLKSEILGSYMRARIAELRGKNLACACKMPHPGKIDMCHARVLLEISNSPTCEAAP